MLWEPRAEQPWDVRKLGQIGESFQSEKFSWQTLGEATGFQEQGSRGYFIWSEQSAAQNPAIPTGPNRCRTLKAPDLRLGTERGLGEGTSPGALDGGVDIGAPRLTGK